jgi:hypothetical protein
VCSPVRLPIGVAGWHVDHDAWAKAVSDLLVVPVVALGEPLREPLASDELLSLSAIDRVVLKCPIAEIAMGAVARNARHPCDVG